MRLTTLNMLKSKFAAKLTELELSKEDIEKMVNEADKYAEDDRHIKEKIEARNSLESYTYNLKNTASGELAAKLTEEDKKTIEEKSSEVISWLEENQDCISDNV